MLHVEPWQQGPVPGSPQESPGIPQATQVAVFVSQTWLPQHS